MNRSVHAAAVFAGLILIGLLSSCARLPYVTSVVHDDRRVMVALERELDQPRYAHPVQLSRSELTAILEGFSFRPKQRLPLRWFAEETPPKPLFRHDELEALTGHLSEGLRAAGPDERVRFELRAPGLNPNERRDVIAGWVAVRDPYLYFRLDYVHVQVPTHKSDPYDYNYPTPPSIPADYLLYFEPGRFWVADQAGVPALAFREFLNMPRPGAAPSRR